MQCPKEVDSLCQKVKQESPETMFEACTEVCQNNKNGRTPDNRICLSLVLSMQLNTRKMGENGAGIMKKPVSKGMPKNNQIFYTTDLGSQIGIWKFSNFLATLILCT